MVLCSYEWLYFICVNWKIIVLVEKIIKIDMLIFLYVNVNDYLKCDNVNFVKFWSILLKIGFIKMWVRFDYELIREKGINLCKGWNFSILVMCEVKLWVDFDWFCVYLRKYYGIFFIEFIVIL